jgi:hypothetical protein
VAQPSPVSQAALVIGALLVVMVCSLAGEHLNFSVIRLLEGYWPARLRRPLAGRLAGAQGRARRALE